MDLSTKQKQTDIENRLVAASGLGGGERDGLGDWGWQMQAITFKMDKQQGPTVQHRELYSMSCDKP